MAQERAMMLLITAWNCNYPTQIWIIIHTQEPQPYFKVTIVTQEKVLENKMYSAGLPLDWNVLLNRDSVSI